jgi:hypothetical protein
MYITSQQYFRFIFRNLKFDDKIKNCLPKSRFIAYTICRLIGRNVQEGASWRVLKLVCQKFICRETLPSWTPLALEIKIIKTFFI